MNSNSNNMIKPELVEPMKILHIQEKDSFFSVHHDFLVIIVIFIVLITIACGIFNRVNRQQIQQQDVLQQKKQ